MRDILFISGAALLLVALGIYHEYKNKISDFNKTIRAMDNELNAFENSIKHDRISLVVHIADNIANIKTATGFWKYMNSSRDLYIGEVGRINKKFDDMVALYHYRLMLFGEYIWIFKKDMSVEPYIVRDLAIVNPELRGILSIALPNECSIINTAPISDYNKALYAYYKNIADALNIAI